MNKLFSVPFLSLALLSSACDEPAPSGPVSEIEMIGTPAWKLVDFHNYAATVGTPATNFAEVMESFHATLPPPQHAVHPDLGIGPGVPHNGPYDEEHTEGLLDAGFSQGPEFLPEQVRLDQGLFTCWMAVPRLGGALGSSPDFKLGPIIPHEVFPIHLTADLFRDGVQLSLHNEFDINALDEIDPAFAVDGHSHFPLYLAYWFGNGNPKAGVYEWRVNMLDATGAGWNVRVPATILAAEATQ